MLDKQQENFDSTALLFCLFNGHSGKERRMAAGERLALCPEKRNRICQKLWTSGDDPSYIDAEKGLF